MVCTLLLALMYDYNYGNLNKYYASGIWQKESPVQQLHVL